MSQQPSDNRMLRRQGDFPVLIVSQDYELFFRDSGSIEKCLFEPTEHVLTFAKKTGVKVTFYVDAGMLCCLQRQADIQPRLARDLSRIQAHIESLHKSGHEIGLHIHPHWEETRWANGAWDFSRTRYQLRDFSPEEVDDIVSRYTGVLNEMCDGEVRSYRAGGFCVEPFEQLRKPLLSNGISIDSSIVPGAKIDDPDKGFDFSGAPTSSWWRFRESPSTPDRDGDFIEIPVTANVLPVYHYWGRALDRILKRRPSGVYGDGTSKRLGKTEVLLRLLGGGRVSELSIDAAKAMQLLDASVSRQDRSAWHVMGHPKLLGKNSLSVLEDFIDRKEIRRFDTVTGYATAVRAHSGATS